MSTHPKGACLPRARPEIAWVELDGEAVLLDGARQTLHRLNPTARAVWECCDGSRDTDAIGRELAGAYRGDPAEIVASVRELVGRFTELGLLEGDEAAADP